MQSENEVRLQKLQSLQEKGADPFLQVAFDVTADSAKIFAEFGTLEGKDISIAGRIMTRRVMGKASFFHVQDENGQIQVYIKKDDAGEEAYEEFKHYDIGDIVGVEGHVFKTKTGEISVHAKTTVLLAKSLRGLPEKFHGLKDHEARYRHREVDLIVNKDARDVFVKRSKIIRAIRNLLDSEGFLEVETPILQLIPGGGNARPFDTHHNALNLDMHLRISLELYLKRLIVGGFTKVYEIGRNFRNEGMSHKHNPEFTMLELYQAYTDYHGMMDITERIIKRTAETAAGGLSIQYDGADIDLGKPFERMTMAESVKKYADVDFDALTFEEVLKIAKEHGIHVEKRHKKGHILELFFDEYVEKHLIQPTFITRHPVEISPLAKMCPDNPNYTLRFELFITGKEFANAFSELNDPIDQMNRFKEQEIQRSLGDIEAQSIDMDFVHALEVGMPPTGGVGIGIDRLVMLLTGAVSIRDVLLFPTMKPV